MDIKPLSLVLDSLSPDARARVVAHNMGLVNGSDEDIRSPFFESRPRSEILEEWRAMAEPEVPEWLQEEEESARSHVGPESIQVSWSERRAATAEAFTQQEARYPSAWWNVARNLPRGSLTATTLTDAIDAMPKDSNLGLPAFSRERRYVSDYVDRAERVIRGGYKEDIWPAVLFTRTQATGPTSLPKQRDVWGEDHVETIIGSTIQKPVLEAVRHMEQFAAWNDLDVVDRVATMLLRRTKGPILSIDFSSFDKSVPAKWIEAAFDLLKHMFRPEYRSRIEWLHRQFATVGLLTPDGVYTGRGGGVPSGSALTNLMDSFVHWLIYEHVASQLEVRPTGSTFMGDDGLWLFDPFPPIDEIMGVIKDIGMVANAEKQMVNKERVHFLQRFHSTDWELEGIFRGVRPTNRTLGSAMSFEHRIDPRKWPKAMHTVRWVLQWENNRWHPQFRSFCKLLWKGDKYLQERGLDLSLLAYRAGGEDKIKATLRIESFPFHYRDVTQFDQFATIGVLRQLNR
jgi:hypothetical protein